jgi:cadmium resistance protein CadD (predicted permease)
MLQPLALLGQAIAAFAATNVDDLFVLMVLYASGSRLKTAISGQLLGIGALVVVSLVLSLGAMLVPPEWAGLLGLGPIAIGVLQLTRLRSGDHDEGSAPGLGVLPVAAVTIANGADNIAVYGPLFARRDGLEIAVISAVFAVLVVVWCLGARLLARAPGIARVLERWGHVLAPIVLVMLGLHILWSSGAFLHALARLGIG